MKCTVWVFAAGVLLLAACSKSSTPPAKETNAAAPAQNPLTAPVDYLGAAAAAQKSAVKTVDTAGINQAIQMFNVSEGRYPQNLNELVTEKYLPRLPQPPAGMRFQYDPASGQFSVVRP